jgi:hypothetical protein
VREELLRAGIVAVAIILPAVGLTHLAGNVCVRIVRVAVVLTGPLTLALVLVLKSVVAVLRLDFTCVRVVEVTVRATAIVGLKAEHEKQC